MQLTSIKEGAIFGSSETSELNGLKNTTPSLVQNINSNLANNPIREYVIMSSYNTAITGKYVNVDMIKYVLSQGVRFLDFEIFLINKAPVVAYSSDKNNIILDTNNNILLDTVLSTAVSNAFARPAPNNTDPLFIQLRIKSTDPSIYSLVAKSITFALSAKLHAGKVTNHTHLSELMNKIVIVMDKSINRNYATDCLCSSTDTGCVDLNSLINIESGSDTLYLKRYSELLNQCSTPINILDKCSTNDGTCTDVQKMRVVLPDVNLNVTKNPDLSPFVLNYGCQVLMPRFYLNDTQLAKYQSFFNSNKSAFVPLAYAIQYIQKQKS
jgi:hypothetical protein